MNCSDFEKPKILIVDDYPISRRMAISFLVPKGYQIVEAENGANVVPQVQQINPDLILLDIMMPGLNGYEVCRRLKQDEKTRLIPIIFVTSLIDRYARLKGIEVGADDFLSKPYDPLELQARVKALIHQKRLNEDLDHASQVLFSIARTIERRDPNTGNHCERLVAQGKRFGQYLGLSRLELRDLTWGAYLHDIGKVGIPDAILLKPGRLTLEELQIMQQHVLIGEQICQPLRTMQGVQPIIRHHHERWDGTGYPDGLKGNQIPFLAQVFQLVDVYDALSSDRPYKYSHSPQESLKIMIQEMEQGWRSPELMARFVEFIEAEIAAA